MSIKFDTCNLSKCDGFIQEIDKCTMVGCTFRGAWRALQAMKEDVAIIIHGPRGCNNEFKLDYAAGVAKTYNVGITENEIIYGGEEKLRKYILHIDKNMKPKLIVVLVTCSGELIGDNVEAVIDTVSGKISSQIFSLHVGGMSGKIQSEGHNSVNTMLADKIMKRQETTPNSVNFLGYYFQWGYRKGHDLLEIKKLLNSIDVELNTTITSGSSVKDIERAPSASLNVVHCPSSTYGCVEVMEKKFGTPYIYPGPPIGVENTNSFLREVAKFFSLEKNAEKVIKRKSKKAEIQMKRVKRYLENKRVAICLGPNKTPQLASFLADLGMEVELISYYRIWDVSGEGPIKIAGRTTEILDRVCKNKKINSDVVFYSSGRELLEILEEGKFDIIFDSRFDRRFILDMGSIFYESMDYPQPFFGYNGAVLLSYDLAKLFINNFNKRYSKYIKKRLSRRFLD